MELNFSFYSKLCILCILIANIDVATGVVPALVPVIIAGTSLVVSMISMSLSADTVAARKKSAETDEENRLAMMNKLEEIRSLVGKIEDNTQAIRGISNAIQSEGSRILEQLSLKADMQKVEQFFNVITYVEREFNNQFMKYVGNIDKYHNSTIDHYLGEMIDDNEFKYKLDFIVDSIVKTHEEKLLEVNKIFDVIKAYLIKNSDKYLCGTKSLYDQMFGIYNLAVATLAKGYTMIGYAYNIRRARLLDPNAFKQEILDVVKNFKEAAIKITKNARNYIKDMDKIEYKRYELCDPEEWKEGENYFGLKRFLAAYVWPANYHEYFSRNAIQSMSYPQIRCVNSFDRRCSEHQFIHICFAPPESGRRYWSAEEKMSFETEGRNTTLITQTIGIPNKECVTYNTLKNLTGVFFKSCICDESLGLKGSIRSFSLREHLTNVSNNRVVTGVRFNVQIESVTIEMQEGTLVNGIIDPTSVKWNEFYGMIPDDGHDSVNLSWNMRSLNLDDVVLPKGEFVTGVKFVVENNRIALRVAGTKMYDDTGFLIANPETKWRSSSNSDYGVTRLDSPSSIVPYRNDVVEFDVSSWEEDFSQTVLPFFDSREITTNPPSPLGGIGIYYKNHKQRMTEFVSLKTISSEHNRLLTDEQLNVFKNTDHSNNFILSNNL